MGGLAKHALTLARALRRDGHQVDLLASAERPWDPDNAELALDGRVFQDLSGSQRGWKELTLGCFMPPRRAFTARRFARLIQARAQDYDVVHYHGHVADVGAFIPASVNFVQTRHDQGADCLIHQRFKAGQICAESAPEACAGCVSARPNGWRRAISALAVVQYRERVRRAMLRHKTLFVSNMLRVNLCRCLGGSPEDWGYVVNNFIDDAPLEAPAYREPDAPRRVFGAGKLYDAKGFAPFLAEISSRLPADMIVTIAGGGPQEADFRARYCDPRYQFLGWVDPPTVMSQTAAADFIVVPSVWEEPCSTSILEGLALGKPVYALARGGTPELARYERYPGQLRLFDAMSDLAEALARAKPVENQVDLSAFTGTVAHRLPEILAVYQAPRRAWR